MTNEEWQARWDSVEAALIERFGHDGANHIMRSAKRTGSAMGCDLVSASEAALSVVERIAAQWSRLAPDTINHQSVIDRSE